MAQEDQQTEESNKIADELDFDDKDLEVIEISDGTLEVEDAVKTKDQKEAKKRAKKILGPEEKKRQKQKRVLIIGGSVGALLLLLFIVPFTRWPILNAIGLRGTVKITVLQQGSQRPVENASVQLANGVRTTTNKKGIAIFSHEKLGKVQLLVQKDGYGDLATSITNGLGTSHPKLLLKAIGIKLDVDVTNWLSDAPVAGATVSYGKSTATSDGNGRASLIIPPTDKVQIEILVSAPSYLNKTVKTNVSAASREVSLVASQKDYFISKRDGKFDIFSSNLDGSDQQKIVEATGKEDSSLLQFTVNRTNTQAILVATRDGTITNGKIVAGIYKIDLVKATLQKIDEGSDVQLLDWTDSGITYLKSVPSLKYDDPGLSRLMNYNAATGKLVELAQANYFSVAVTAQNKVFYLPADAYRAVEGGVLTSKDLVGGAKRTYLESKVINYGARTTYNTLGLVDSSNVNYELQINTGVTKAVDKRPGSSLAFAISPDGQQTAWTDQRDGQGALLASPTKNITEKTIAKAGGLMAPIRFITNDLIVVRIVTSQETADYVVSVTTGKMAKVVDVSNIGAVSTNL